MKWKSRSCVCLWPHGLYSPWNSPGQNTGVGSCSLLQGIFPTWGSNQGLLHCRRILYQLSHKGSPGILEWVGYPFSSRSSQPRNQTQVSCIVSGFCTSWATRKAQEYWSSCLSLIQGIFQTRDPSGVSWIGGGFFTSWATREADRIGRFEVIDLSCFYRIGYIREKCQPGTHRFAFWLGPYL